MEVGNQSTTIRRGKGRLAEAGTNGRWLSPIIVESRQAKQASTELAPVLGRSSFGEKPQWTETPLDRNPFGEKPLGVNRLDQPSSFLSEPMSCPKTTDELDDLLSRPDPKVLEAVDACPGNIAVLGAGGKMGFHTARMLQRSVDQLGRPDPVFAVSRFTSESSREAFERCGIETIRADLSDAGQVAALPDAANLFFLAGMKFGTAHDVDLLYRFNGLMPRLVAERFADSRIVALSTGCVYSFTSAESGGSTEQSETDPPGDYAKSCLQREQAFIDGSQASGTPCSLVRLNYSVELRYGVLVDIATQVFDGQPVSVETPYVNVIWQRDAISQIVQCLPCAQSPPFIVNITGAETLSVRDLADRFGKRFGKPVTFTGQEADTCWLSNSTLARGRFGDPPMELDRMIEWIAEWIEEGRETLGKPTKFHVRDGKY